MSKENRLARISTNILAREVQGEMVLLQLDRGEYFGLDEVATRIWQLIAERGNLSEVEAAILAEYDTDPATLSRDFDQFVQELAANQLIEIEVVAPPRS